MVASPDEEINDLLQDLEIIKNLGNLDINRIPPSLFQKLKKKESREYIQGLSISKPEAILCDKFFLPIMNKLVSNFPQARTGSGGWVDYMIPQSGESLPVAIEVKSLHKTDGHLNLLSDELKEMVKELENTKWNQIVRYLVGADAFDYVILTNLDDVYYFNREAVKKFEPFFREKFTQFIESLRLTRNVWDTAKRRDESIPRKDLSTSFYKDLKTWYEWLKEIKWVKDGDESSVFLINKLIFALTLEDIGVIRFKHVLREYERSKTLYDRKGSRAVLADFFKSIDEFLYRYYDTELFKESNDILKKVDPDKSNINKLKNVIERLLGYSTSTSAFTSGLYSYNYRFIDEDVFGKSYETFLAGERKDRGIYYTPRQITAHMSSELVANLFKRRVDEIIDYIDKGELQVAKNKVESLLQLKIIDPACGSGPFLVGCLRGIFNEYKRIEEKTSWADRFNGSTLSEPEEMKARREKTYEIRELLGFQRGYRDHINYRGLVSKIIVSHLYGVDLDERALDVAKVNIWKEAIKLHPSSFVYDQLPEDENHILPDLRMNLVLGDSIVSPSSEEIAKILFQEHKVELARLMELRADYINNPNNPELIDKILSIKGELRNKILGKFDEFAGKTPLLFPLDFFFAYFSQSGDMLPSTEIGFDGVIGNPPWNNVKPNKKEFAQKHPEIFGEISKFSITGKEFETLFQQKLKDEEVAALWNIYEEGIHSLSKFIRAHYRLQGKGDTSLQKTFMERFMQLSKDSFAILVPSGFHTDEGSSELRKEIINKWQLYELISFENRGGVWFPDIHYQFKFDMLLVTKHKTGKPFKARFYVNNWEEVDEAFDYPLELIKILSPSVLGLVEFRSQEDIEIVRTIRNNHKLLGECGYNFSREFDEANDNDLFMTAYSEGGLVVYEGKMIHQFNDHFSENRYWIDEAKGRKRLENSFVKAVSRQVGNEVEVRRLLDAGKLLMDYEVERLVVRRQAGSTNERTLIASMVKPRNFLIDNLSYVEPFRYEAKGESIEQISNSDRDYYLLALLNSFVLDYYIRQRVSANLNFFFLYELPIPDVSEEVMKRVVSLAKGLMKDSSDRKKRSELEILIGKEIFGLRRKDMDHILDSFTYGNVDTELIQLIKENYDR